MIKRETTVVMSADGARRLGRYVLCGEIAEGGMGKIYLARAQGAAGFEKLFAVKVILPDKIRAHPELVEMFLDEARIAASIQHPNVCQVTDFGEERGVPYLVMEHLTGKPVHKILGAMAKKPEMRNDPRLYGIAARIAAEACEGLHAAHTAKDRMGRELKIVHRDVSPENIFLTYSGAVRVMDFGIARAATKQHETATGVFKGKLAYAPPEAFRGVRLDYRADIWGAGVVLWEMLTGLHLFFRDNEAATMAAVLDEPIMPPSRVRAEVPPELDAVVMRALRRKPEERYDSCRLMAQDLNRFAVMLGEHIGSAEMGDWLRGIFPDAEREAFKAAQVVQSLKSEVGSIPDLIQAAGGRARISEIVARDVSAIDVPLPESLSGNDPWPSREATAPLDEHGNVVSPELTRRARPNLAQPIVFNSMEGPPTSGARPLSSRPGLSHSGSSHSGSSHPGLSHPGSSHPGLSPSGSSRPGLASSPGMGSASGAHSTPGGLNPVGVDPIGPTAHGSSWPAPDPSHDPNDPAYDLFDGETTVHTPGVDASAFHAPTSQPAKSGVDREAAGPTFQAPPDETKSRKTTSVLIMFVVVVALAAAAVWGLILWQQNQATSANQPPVLQEPVENTESVPEAETPVAPREPVILTGEPIEDEPSAEPEESPAVPTMIEGTNSEPRAPRPPAQPSEPGTLRVVASGDWADIFERGRRLGRTPTRLELSPGRHVLVFRFSGGQEKRRTVNIRSGESSSLSVGPGG